MLLNENDDISRNLRTILHDVTKTYKADIRFEKFITSLMSPRLFSSGSAIAQIKTDEQSVKDRKLLCLMDIALLAECLLMITRYRDDISVGTWLLLKFLSQFTLLLFKETTIVSPMFWRGFKDRN